MSIATFRGGVHPYEGKDLSKDLPIKTVQPKKELVFPMGQHIGAPATPIVAKGDKVLVGQKIGEASGSHQQKVSCNHDPLQILQLLHTLHHFR